MQRTQNRPDLHSPNPTPNSISAVLLDTSLPVEERTKETLHTKTAELGTSSVMECIKGMRKREERWTEGLVLVEASTEKNSRRYHTPRKFALHTCTCRACQTPKFCFDRPPSCLKQSSSQTSHSGRVTAIVAKLQLPSKPEVT